MFAGTPFNARIGKFFEDNHLQDIATNISAGSAGQQPQDFHNNEFH